LEGLEETFKRGKVSCALTRGCQKSSARGIFPSFSSRRPLNAAVDPQLASEFNKGLLDRFCLEYYADNTLTLLSWRADMNMEEEIRQEVDIVSV
jgi:hypothetical protein